MNRNGRHHLEELRIIARRVMNERGFFPDFSPEVTTELVPMKEAAIDAGPGLRDLRHLLWASIDNDDSLDLDQLTVAEPLTGKSVKILVAVADVDALVKKESAIDGHARHNTTSVYTAAEIFPMLPEKLSTDLTSLKDGEDRLAIVVEMVVNGDGLIDTSGLYPAAVHNHAKLAYNSVAAWLDGAGPLPERMAAVPGIDQQIRVQDGIAQRLKTLRHRFGALDLETIEARPIFAENLLVDLQAEPKNRARELIENFMIAANEVTTKYFDQRGFPSLRRVLHAPERWDRIVRVASELGEHLPPEPDSMALQQFLLKRKKADPLRFPDLSLTIVKLMGSGEYCVDLPGKQCSGHFGLALRDYGHSTAPNRRYPDLVTQRLLKAALSGKPVPYALDELEDLARHCTEREDEANKVERQVRKSAAALLLETRIGERFDGIVTGASEKGTWVRIFHPPIEGKVVRRFQGLDVGDRVHVKLIGTDVERGFIDFERKGV